MHYPSDAKIEWKCRRLRAGETLQGLFGNRWQDVARFNRIDRRHAYPGVSLKIPESLDAIAGFTPMPRVIPSAEAEARYILVDLSEQFLGAYEFGRLVFSLPITTGEPGNETPRGEFRITAAHPQHRSSLYFIEDTDIPYPMNYALRFHISPSGVAYWIHGRDLPGAPVSHGCIGLSDEAMQTHYYGYPKDPVLEDAKTLFLWVLGSLPKERRLLEVKEGPRVLIVGRAPATSPPGP
jgi:lipoprotein-anchoring transpeptidase ErfK/SrfK